MSRLIPPHTVPPSLADLETIAQAAFAEIPDELRTYAADVLIRVEDFPDDRVEQEMGLESPFDLLGLYRGLSLPLQGFSAGAPRTDVDVIHLYRRPILDYWCETGEDLPSLVKHVLIHEIGHHFGFSDEDMERIEDEA